MAPERPLGAAPPEQKAARSPRMRLKRTVLVVMWLMSGEMAWKRRERKRLCRSIYHEKSQVVSPRRSMFGVSSEPMSVPLDLLREITDGFSGERKLGSGSFGEVYLGVHQDGQKIAVKRIYETAGVDDLQFQNEFTNLARLQHRNIVRLVGYCHHIQEVPAMYEGKFVLAEKIHRALCLEYMSNGSLEKYISDECNKYDWHTGYGIIKGICQGLKYLHTELNPPIYHLDLKPANVLLDENMVPRIADFGISRLFGDERTRATKSILGTQGYLPPEYILNNLISSKFDIFSLGVVIIKIMSGRAGYSKITDMSPQEFTNLVQENWTNRLHETSSLMKAYSKQVKICIQIGLMCVNDDRHKRPSIQDIVNRLNETETECTYAARKDRSLIYQDAIGNTSSQYAQDPNDRHSEQIYHGSTFNRDIVATAHSNYLKENAGPREARLDDDSQFYRDDNQEYSTYGFGQHPSMSENGTPYYPPLGNTLNDQGSFSAHPTIPFHNFLSVPEDDLITGASLTGQQNGYFSFSTTDAHVTSYPVAGVAGTSSDGVSLGTSSLNNVQTDIFSGLTSSELQELLELQARLTEQDFVQANIAELPNSNSQFHGYEYDGGAR